MPQITPLLSRRGNAPLYVAFLGVLVLAIALSWLYLSNQAAFGGLNIPIPFLPTPAPINTSTWKSYQLTEGLTVWYPPDWLIVENQYISQYSFTPGRTTSDVSNTISAHLIESQLQTSYVNDDWFDRMYNAKKDQLVSNEYRPTEQQKFKKLESGKTLAGNRFVLFIDPKSPLQVQAYLNIPNTKFYQLSIDHYDQAGAQRFKDIISTAIITQ